MSSGTQKAESFKSAVIAAKVPLEDIQRHSKGRNELRCQNRAKSQNLHPKKRLFLFKHLIPQCFQQNWSVINPLNTDACTAAADRPVGRIVVYMAEKIGIGHASADIKRLMGENKEFIQNDRQVIALLEAQIPPLLWSQILVVVAHHKNLVPLQLREKLTASLRAAGAEISEVIDEVLIVYGRIPASDHFQIHCVGIGKRPLFIDPYIIISEMGIRDQEDPAFLVSGVHPFLLVLPRLKGAFP
jgi:hypothetical protein